jgi:hypothetical protein
MREPLRQPGLAGLVHVTVTEWTAETAPEDGVIGHPVVLHDGTLNPAAAECRECSTRFAAAARGEPVDWSSGADQEEPLGDPDWRCPVHGKATIKSRADGRPYRGCPDCGALARWSPDDPRAPASNVRRSTGSLSRGQRGSPSGVRRPSR